MDTSFYTDIFKKAAGRLDKKRLAKKKLEAAVVLYKENSVVLKLYKRSWANESQDPLTSASRIFYSVWVSDATIKEEQLRYNIHALKLRQLKGYSIQSRKFADSFRDRFKVFAHQWENVSVHFGPLTLMEGWIKMDSNHLQENILKLANNFLDIEYLVDDILAGFKQ